MTDRKPYALLGFRTSPADGKSFAALVPNRGVLNGAEAVEVPCPKAVLDMRPEQQEEWARKEAVKRNLWT